MKIKISKTNYAGRGIFAAQNIKKNEYIFTFEGEIIRDSVYAHKLNCTLQIGPNMWINPKNSFSRYVNHLCDPNAGIKGKRQIVAMRDIWGGGNNFGLFNN